MRKVTLRFSVTWCIGLFLLHIGVTMLLGLVMFAGGMESFTHGLGATYHVASIVMWVWNPVVMLMVEGHNLEIARSPVIGPVLWSMMVGVLVGLIGGTLSKHGRNRQVVPGSNPDLIGTPWTHDSGFTLDKTDSAKQIKQAEQDASEGDMPPN